MDEMMKMSSNDLPDWVSYQIVCGATMEDTIVNEYDFKTETCSSKNFQIRPQLLPEYTFFVRMVCEEMSPKDAWAQQCATFDVSLLLLAVLPDSDLALLLAGLHGGPRVHRPGLCVEAAQECDLFLTIRT